MNLIKLPLLVSAMCGGMLGVSLLSLCENMMIYGPGMYYAWLIGLPAIMFLTQTFAYLSSKLDGGPYGYVHEIFGKNLGFIVGYIYLLAIILQQTAVIYTSGIAYGHFFGEYSFWILPILCGFSQLTTLKTVLEINNIMNLLKLAPFVLVILVGFVPGVASMDLNHAPSNLIIMSPLTLIFFAFGGMEFNTINNTEEIEAPEKNIPLALQISTALTAIFYITLQITICQALAPGQSIYDAFDKLLFTGASNVLSVTGIIIGWYSISFGINIGAQLISQMAKRGDMPLVVNRYQNASTSIIGVIIATILPMCFLPPLIAAQGYSPQYKILVEFFDLLYASIYFMCALGHYLLVTRDTINRHAIIPALSIASSILFMYASYPF